MQTRYLIAVLVSILCAMGPEAGRVFAQGQADAASTGSAQQSLLLLNEQGYFEARGVNVLVFSNWYSGLFSDSKLSGVEIIHHGERTGTNGDVRLSNTPEQWDPIPELESRDVDAAAGRVVASLRYPDFGFRYRVTGEPAPDGGVLIGVELDEALPATLEGMAGFNLEFLPSTYFGKTFLADGRGGQFPRTPGGPMYRDRTGKYEATPLASGRILVLAPDEPQNLIAIDGHGATLSLYDGRNKAQNGWFVVRSLIPANRTGRVLEWTVTPNRLPNWTRKPVIAHSQVGYHPDFEKVAVIELDRNYDGPLTTRLFRLGANGDRSDVLERDAEAWGEFLRYDYARFDFTSVSEPGLYRIAFGDVWSHPFRIDPDVYGGYLWQNTLDTFMPVQMDHVLVNDRYRVWHGASHLDDALQAPVDHVHIDLYAQGPTTDTPYQPREHIPGLSVGGWYDAGDFDIRTQSQYGTVSMLVHAHETFGIEWDETTVDQENRYVDLRRPDGIPDVVQQVEHGVLALLAQYRAVGHAIPGIVEPSVEQYTHLGDAVTKTDNLVHDPTLDSLAIQYPHSGTFDDRWAFTSKSSALDYGSAAALAAASRVLRGYRDDLADEALQTAVQVWDEEQSREPVIFRHGNTTGGRLEDEELKATVELLLTTGAPRYRDRLRAMWPFVEQNFLSTGVLAVRAMPHMDEEYEASVRTAVASAAAQMDAMLTQNPFGVPITRGGWGGNGAVMGHAVRAYVFNEAFPDLVGPEHVLRAVHYILGTHPASSVSMVSGIGAFSKTIAYGMNRADFSFIPGGIVPGIVIIQPDLPELQLEWPFLWFENEYVIPTAPLWIFAAHAADNLVRR